MPHSPLDITFVTTKSGDPSLFERNFSASPTLKDIPANHIIVQEGYSSAAMAYNEAIDRAQTDLIVFAHQDVYFPERWLDDLHRSLRILEVVDPDWGVLGGWGVDRLGVGSGYVYSVGLGVLGQPFEHPIPVATLDEYTLILRKSSGLRFDPTIPHFHFYGMDICMAARENNKSCYAISALSVHNTSGGYLSPEFYGCYWHARKKWREFLPVWTSCIKVSVWNEDLIVRKLKRIWFSMIGRNIKPLPRLEDPRPALQSLGRIPSSK